MKHKWPRRPFYKCQSRMMKLHSLKKGNNKLSWKQVWPAWISAFAVVVAVGFSIYTFIHTRNLMKRTERPNLAFFYDKAHVSPSYDDGKMVGIIEFRFRNIGKHPAKDVRWLFVFAPAYDLSEFKKTPPMETANNIDPEAGTNFRLHIKYDLTEQEIHEKQYIKREYFILLLLSYSDTYLPENEYVKEYWFKYRIGEEQTVHATVHEREIFEPVIDLEFPVRKK